MPVSTHPEAAEIARKELSVFVETAEGAGMSPECLGRLLRLSPRDWRQWLDVLDDQPVPPELPLPLLLRHLGYLTSRLDRAARASCA